jgi:hypothetical protein
VGSIPASNHGGRARILYLWWYASPGAAADQPGVQDWYIPLASVSIMMTDFTRRSYYLPYRSKKESGGSENIQEDQACSQKPSSKQRVSGNPVNSFKRLHPLPIGSSESESGPGLSCEYQPSSGSGASRDRHVKWRLVNGLRELTGAFCPPFWLHHTATRLASNLQVTRATHSVIRC